MEFDELSRRVIGCAIEVHKGLGPGLLESAYGQCLAYELSRSNISFKFQQPVPVTYKSILLDCGYRIDVFIEDALIVELKSVERLHPYQRSSIAHLYEACKSSDWSAD
jgi:GxxExxY protein